MADIDLSREPPDAALDHPPSRRHYQVRRRDGQFWHRELLLTGPGTPEVVLDEYPLRYVVGSGRHSLTYLVEIDGFLVESPVTWYTSRKAWGMSPGYDRPGHAGFQRAVGESCLYCHAGHAETVGGSLHRMRITEAAISCERCHGPGSLHVERHTGRQRPTGEGDGGIDFTIVNPRHLSRELAEAICQQCHLRSSAQVVARGRKLVEYRPGLPLQDFRADYRLTTPDDTMTVVGHVEQMHLSRCYQKSATLSCSSCHDPHNEPAAEERTGYYQAICVSCHQPERCTVSPQRRQRESPENNCVHCHMPTAPTEIPHLAFTHHRIGIHTPTANAVSARKGPGVLEPFLDLSRWSEFDRQRMLGLGYLDLVSQEQEQTFRMHYQQEALRLLTAVRAAGLRDPAVDTALARARFALDLDEFLPYAESALADPRITDQDRCDALFLVADALVRQKRHAEAARVVRQLNGLRRHALQWLLLADCERALGNLGAVEEALRTAVRINPRLTHVHRHLAELYRQRGDAARAAWHENRVVP